jgi:hypothetical protein
MTSVADAMASNGIEEAGYKYVVIDVAGRSDRTKALSFATPAGSATVASHSVVMVKVTP